MKATIHASVIGQSAAGICHLLEETVRPGPGAENVDPSARLRALLCECERESEGDLLFQMVDRLSSDLVREALEALSCGAAKGAGEALQLVSAQIEQALEATGRRELLDRAQDIRDLCSALMRKLQIAPEARKWNEKTILVGRRISLCDALEAVRRGVGGVMVLNYNPVSHAAVALRSGGIPVVTGFDALEPFFEGMRIAFDAQAQQILLEPDRDTWNRCASRSGDAAATAEIGQSVLLGDGTELRIGLNCMGSFEKLPAQANIGLLRTEFFCAGRAVMPDEAELAEEYAAIVSRYPSVTIRLFDFNGDKLPDMPVRQGGGMRFLLAQRQILDAQLRAVLRATALGNVRILLPMVCESAEVVQVRRRMMECCGELRAQGVSVPYAPPVGAMIETPAAAIMVDQLCEVIDFASIGTNDLCAYVMGQSREDAQPPASLTEPLLRLMEQVLRTLRERNKPVCVCGELAATPEGMTRLMEMGFREFSLDIRFAREALRLLADGQK